MTINEAVRALRKALGESQQAFAMRVGLSIRAIANYEKDRKPDLKSLMLLIDAVDREHQAEIYNVLNDCFFEELGHFRSALSLIDTNEEKSCKERLSGLAGERDRLRAALIESLIVWENNSLQDHIQSGPFIDDIINVALSTTPAPQPKTGEYARLREALEKIQSKRNHEKLPDYADLEKGEQEAWNDAADIADAALSLPPALHPDKEQS